MLIVRARNGNVLLRVTVTDAGPVLAFEAAEIELRSTRTLRLAAETIDISASNLPRRRERRNAHIAGSRHTRIDAADHLEASSVQVQQRRHRAARRGPHRPRRRAHRPQRRPVPAACDWSAIAGGPEAPLMDEKEGV